MKSKNHTKYDSLTEREEALSSEAPGASQGPVARSDPWEWGLEGHSTSPPQLRSPTRDPTHPPVLPCTFPGYSQNPAQLCRWICGTAQALCTSSFSSQCFTLPLSGCNSRPGAHGRVFPGITLPCFLHEKGGKLSLSCTKQLLLCRAPCCTQTGIQTIFSLIPTATKPHF